jgi:hypothetical protein
MPGSLLHTMLVDETKDVSAQSVTPIRTVLDRSPGPKLTPVSVRLVPPEVGEFMEYT